MRNLIEVAAGTVMLLMTIFAVAVASASVSTMHGNELVTTVVQQLAHK